jgi:hypothetical protein
LRRLTAHLRELLDPDGSERRARAASTESFIPAQLASLLDKLLADGPPPRPIDISSPP